MPWEAPETPLKMFPPPTTMASSVPPSTTWLISAAMARNRAGSIPYSRSPMRASPLSLSRTLFHTGCWVMTPRFGHPSWRGPRPEARLMESAPLGHLVAHAEAREPPDLYVLTDLADQLTA